MEHRGTLQPLAVSDDTAALKPKGLTPRDANSEVPSSPAAVLRRKAQSGELTPSSMRMHELLEWKAKKLACESGADGGPALKDTSSPSFLELLPSYEKLAKQQKQSSKQSSATKHQIEVTSRSAARKKPAARRTRGAAPSAEQAKGAANGVGRPRATGAKAPRSLLSRPVAIPVEPQDSAVTPAGQLHGGRGVPDTARAVVGSGGRARARSGRRRREGEKGRGRGVSVARRQQAAAERHAARLEAQRRREEESRARQAELEARMKAGKRARGRGSSGGRGARASGGEKARVKQSGGEHVRGNDMREDVLHGHERVAEAHDSGIGGHKQGTVDQLMADVALGLSTGASHDRSDKLQEQQQQHHHHDGAEAEPESPSGSAPVEPSSRPRPVSAGRGAVRKGRLRVRSGRAASGGRGRVRASATGAAGEGDGDEQAGVSQVPVPKTAAPAVRTSSRRAGGLGARLSFGGRAVVTGRARGGSRGRGRGVIRDAAEPAAASVPVAGAVEEVETDDAISGEDEITAARAEFEQRQAKEGWWDSPSGGHPDGSGRAGREQRALGGFMSPLAGRKVKGQGRNAALGTGLGAGQRARPVVRVRPVEVPRGNKGKGEGARRSLLPVPRRASANDQVHRTAIPRPPVCASSPSPMVRDRDVVKVGETLMSPRDAARIQVRARSAAARAEAAPEAGRGHVRGQDEEENHHEETHAHQQQQQQQQQGVEGVEGGSLEDGSILSGVHSDADVVDGDWHACDECSTQPSMADTTDHSDQNQDRRRSTSPWSLQMEADLEAVGPPPSRPSLGDGPGREDEKGTGNGLEHEQGAGRLSFWSRVEHQLKVLDGGSSGSGSGSDSVASAAKECTAQTGSNSAGADADQPVDVPVTATKAVEDLAASRRFVDDLDSESETDGEEDAAEDGMDAAAIAVPQAQSGYQADSGTSACTDASVLLPHPVSEESTCARAAESPMVVDQSARERDHVAGVVLVLVAVLALLLAAYAGVQHPAVASYASRSRHQQGQRQGHGQGWLWAPVSRVTTAPALSPGAQVRRVELAGMQEARSLLLDRLSQPRHEPAVVVRRRLAVPSGTGWQVEGVMDGYQVWAPEQGRGVGGVSLEQALLSAADSGVGAEAEAVVGADLGVETSNGGEAIQETSQAGSSSVRESTMQQPMTWWDEAQAMPVPMPSVTSPSTSATTGPAVERVSASAPGSGNAGAVVDQRAVADALGEGQHHGQEAGTGSGSGSGSRAGFVMGVVVLSVGIAAVQVTHVAGTGRPAAAGAGASAGEEVRGGAGAAHGGEHVSPDDEADMGCVGHEGFEDDMGGVGHEGFEDDVGLEKEEGAQEAEAAAAAEDGGMASPVQPCGQAVVERTAGAGTPSRLVSGPSNEQGSVSVLRLRQDRPGAPLRATPVRRSRRLAGHGPKSTGRKGAGPRGTGTGELQEGIDVEVTREQLMEAASGAGLRLGI